MTLKLYGITGYNGAVISDQTTCTPANTNALQVNNLSGSVVRWVADTTFGGQWAIECINTANNAASLRVPFGAATQTLSEAYSIKLPALATDTANPVTILTIRDETNTSAKKVPIQVQLLNTGQIDVKAGVAGIGAGQASLPAPKSQTNGTPAALVPGNNYRIEVFATCADGQVSVRVSDHGAAAGNYIAEAKTTVAAPAAIGTFSFTHSDLGLGSYPSARTLRFSNARLEDSSASYLGPYVASTPQFDATVVMTPDEATGETTATLAVSRVNGTGTGTTVTVTVVWGDGATSPATLAPNGSITMSHVYTNPPQRVVYNWSVRVDLTA